MVLIKGLEYNVILLKSSTISSKSYKKPQLGVKRFKAKEEIARMEAAMRNKEDIASSPDQWYTRDKKEKTCDAGLLSQLIICLGLRS